MLIFFYIIWLWVWSFLLWKLFIKYFMNHNWHIEDISEEELKKDWDYERFLKYSIFIFLFQFFVLIISIIFMYFDENSNSRISNYILAFSQIVLNISFLIIMLKVFRKLIDFENDFTIVVPWEIIFINQSWLFSRQMKSLDVDKIKSISINKQWIIRALFNVWSLIIFSEWDESTNNWEIKLKWLYSPETIQTRIEEIIWKKNEKKD